ncbi:MAG: GntR family transcriptional regulator, partial [Clostridiales bacterium]|nr:GntR family transcriptional regulator [Clostridiales bacterium]
MFKYSELKLALKAETERLPVGARLPTRRELREKYECTRTTVDRAVAELAREGYVSSRQGSGTYVADRGGGDAGAPGSVGAGEPGGGAGGIGASAARDARGAAGAYAAREAWG